MTTPFPNTFPHRNKYRTYDRAHNHTGYSPTPQYPGQSPISYPEDATLAEIWVGGYVR